MNRLTMLALCLALAGCGAGLDEPDPRPVLDVPPVCENPTASKSDPNKPGECLPVPKEG